jgi:hypothetical protein
MHVCKDRCRDFEIAHRSCAAGKELISLGHEVTLFVSGDSATSATAASLASHASAGPTQMRSRCRRDDITGLYSPSSPRAPRRSWARSHAISYATPMTRRGSGSNLKAVQKFGDGHDALLCLTGGSEIVAPYQSGARSVVHVPAMTRPPTEAAYFALRDEGSRLERRKIASLAAAFASAWVPYRTPLSSGLGWAEVDLPPPKD